MEKIAFMCTKEWEEQIDGAIARGWCHPENKKKIMDAELAKAISYEVKKLLKTDEHPKLGCATTRQIIDELAARLDVDMEYRTID